MSKLQYYFKRNVLLMLFLWLGVTITQAQTNEKSSVFKIGIGYSRLPLEPLEEHALDLWYAPISLLVSYEPKPFVRFTLSFGYGREKDITTSVIHQIVLGLGAFYLLRINLLTPYLGVRTGLVQRNVSSSNEGMGRLDAKSYFVQAVIGGEVAIFKRLRVGLEMVYQYASPKFWEKGLWTQMVRYYPDAGYKLGSNILVHYSLPI